MESKVNRDNHITICGWMITDLNLSGTELMIYAIIYGFSQDGQSIFYGSRQYLADWCNTSVRTIQTSLNNLVEKGLIESVDYHLGSAIKYKANRVCKNFTGGCEKIAQGCEKIAHNNIDNSKKENIENSILKNTTATPPLDDSKENITERPKRRILVNDDFSNKSYDSEKEEKQKTKKLNMYDKCILEIDNFTTDEKLKEALRTYLGIRLNMKDKKLLGVNQFKGLLKTLSNLKGDKVAIVERATERGWASFFELKDYQYSNYKKPDCSVFGETPQMRSVSPEEVEGGESSGIIF